MTTTDALTYARAALDAHEEAYRAKQAHDARVREHAANRPVAPKGKRPEAPTVARVTPEEVAAARRTRQLAAESAGAIRTADAAVERAETELAAALAAETAALADAKRAPLLVAACRRAPGDEAAASLAAMGDTGDTRIEFAGADRAKNDPYVRILWRGVDFEDLSRGEKVKADLDLRLGWRRASGLLALPIVVDDVGAYNDGDGPWPDVEGASIWLVTTAPPSSLPTPKLGDGF